MFFKNLKKKNCPQKAEIPLFQKFLCYCLTAQMAEFKLQNVAYRASVHGTGGQTNFSTDQSIQVL